MVGRILKKREQVRLWLFTPNFRGKTNITISQIENSGNIWFIFTTTDFRMFGFEKNKSYWVHFNDGLVIFKVKFKKYKNYWLFWINAQYLPHNIYSISFEEVEEDGEGKARV